MVASRKCCDYRILDELPFMKNLVGEESEYSVAGDAGDGISAAVARGVTMKRLPIELDDQFLAEYDIDIPDPRNELLLTNRSAKAFDAMHEHRLDPAA